MIDQQTTFAVRWRHPVGSKHFDGVWHDCVGGKGLDIFAALENLQFLKTQCPCLSKQFEHGVFAE